MSGPSWRNDYNRTRPHSSLGDLKPVLATELAADRVARDGFFRPETVKGLIDDHDSRRSLNDKILFSLLVFNKWHAAQGGND